MMGRSAARGSGSDAARGSGAFARTSIASSRIFLIRCSCASAMRAETPAPGAAFRMPASVSASADGRVISAWFMASRISCFWSASCFATRFGATPGGAWRMPAATRSSAVGREASW